MRPWVTLLTVVVFCCLIYQPLIGFCIGVGAVYIAAWLAYKTMGG